MADIADQKVVDFRKVLNERRQIKLVDCDGIWHKAKRVTKVLYACERKNDCEHSECGQAYSYVVEVMRDELKIMFYIHGRDGCQSYYDVKPLLYSNERKTSWNKSMTCMN